MMGVFIKGPGVGQDDVAGTRFVLSKAEAEDTLTVRYTTSSGQPTKCVHVSVAVWHMHAGC